MYSGCRKFNSTRRALVALLVIMMVGAFTGVARADVTECFPNLTGTIGPAGTNLVGAIKDVQLNLNFGQVVGGTQVRIPATDETGALAGVRYALDCFIPGLGSGTENCVNDGTTAAYNGPVLISGAGTSCLDISGNPVTWTADHVVGQDDPNIVEFIPSANVILGNGNPNTCFLKFQIELQSLSGDATPTTVQSAGGFQAVCVATTGADGGGTGSGSLSTNVNTCEVKIVKQPSCDNGSTFVADADSCDTPETCNATTGSGVGVRYTYQNLGTLALSNCAIGDTNTDSSFTSQPNTGFGLAVGSDAVVQTRLGVCSTTFDASEPDTADIGCDCAGIDPNTFRATDQDCANLTCLSPSVNITKVCDSRVNNANQIHVVVSNNGAVALENCSVTDTLYVDSNSTDANGICNGGGATQVIPLDCGDVPDADGQPFSIAVGGAAVNCTGAVSNTITTTSCNKVEVSCTPVGSQTPVTKVAADLCEVGGECFTHTPGFWGTHPGITDDFLPLSSCGILITNVTSGQGSAIQDMCSVGTDPKKVGTSPQQIQLVRQCMAANLNVAATISGGGDCEADFPGLTDTLSACCNGAGSICTSGLGPNATKTIGGEVFSITSCIGFLDAFNNSPDTLDPFGPFLGSQKADPSVCQDSKNDGIVNTGGFRTYGPAK